MSSIQFFKSNVFFKQIGIALASVFIFIFIVRFWLGFTTNHDQKIQVPNLAKMSLSEVKNTLDALDLSYKILDSARYNPDFPKKSIIKQHPEAGDFVKEKRKIYVTLNRSKFRDIEIPDLNGRTKRQATTELLSIGFEVSPDYFWVSDYGKNVVRGLKFEGKKIDLGDKLPRKSTLNLILGDGKK